MKVDGEGVALYTAQLAVNSLHLLQDHEPFIIVEVDVVRVLRILVRRFVYETDIAFVHLVDHFQSLLPRQEDHLIHLSQFV